MIYTHLNERSDTDRTDANRETKQLRRRLSWIAEESLFWPFNHHESLRWCFHPNSHRTSERHPPLYLTLNQVGKLDVLQFLRLSLNCIKGIGAIHSDGVIHRNISPLHILVDRELQIKYIDFSAASVLEKQYQATFDSQLLHGRDLQYISPGE